MSKKSSEMKNAGIEKQKELIVQVQQLSDKAYMEGEEFLHKVLLSVLDFYKTREQGRKQSICKTNKTC